MTPSRRETLEPETLAFLGSTFDETWAAVAATFEHGDDGTKAVARARLASIMLQLADQQVGPEHIKQMAISIFKQSA